MPSKRIRYAIVGLGWIAQEGLADVRIIEALYKSAQQRKLITLKSFNKNTRLDSSQTIKRSGVDKPELIHAKSPKPKS